MKKIFLGLTIISSVAFAATPEVEFEQTKREVEKERKLQEKQAPAKQLEERVRRAGLRSGLRAEEFSVQVSGRKGYLRTMNQVCKLVPGRKTLRGMDCGLTYPSPWAVLGNSCHVDHPEADSLECYPIKK